MKRSQALPGGAITDYLQLVLFAGFHHLALRMTRRSRGAAVERKMLFAARHLAGQRYVQNASELLP